MGRICVVILLGFCLGLLSGCFGAADNDLKLSRINQRIEILEKWCGDLDEGQQNTDVRVVGLQDREREQPAFKHVWQKFLNCDHRLTELERAITTLSNGLANRIEDQRNTLEHTTAKADAAYDNETALAAKLQKLEERIEKDQAELAAVLKQQDQAIELLAAKPQQPKPEPLPAPIVQINHSETKPLKVAPIRCPTGKCPKR